MLLKKHEEKVDGIIFVWILNSEQKTFSSSKKLDDVPDITLIKLCKKLGAEFDFLFDDNGRIKKVLTLEDRSLIIEDFKTADDIWVTKSYDDWWVDFYVF